MAGKDPRTKKDPKPSGGGAPPEPPYWHGHSWQPTDVKWNEVEGKFSDGSPPTWPPGYKGGGG